MTDDKKVSTTSALELSSEQQSDLPASVAARPPSQLIRELSMSSEYSGPVPPPKDVARYNDIVPELGTKLVETFLEENAHRRRIEERETAVREKQAEAEIKIAVADSRRRSVSVWSINALQWAFVGFAMYMAIEGKPMEAFASVISAGAVFFGAYKLGKLASESSKESSEQ